MAHHDKINEKGRASEPAARLSYLQHSLYGIDHYPNYLDKFSVGALDELSKTLRDELQRVEEARDRVSQRAQVLSSYQPLHPWLRDDAQLTPANLFTAEAVAAFGDPEKNDPARSSPALFQVLEETDADAVYTFPLLTTRAAQHISEEMQHFMAWRAANMPAELQGAGGGSRIGILDEAGLTGLADMLCRVVVAPASSILYPEISPIDFRHAYTVGYCPSPDPERPWMKNDALVPHTDDSEVTLNICLGADRFEGGELLFHGLRETMYLPDRPPLLRHRLDTTGAAVIHHGQQFHEVTKVTGGERHVLILWCRSATYRSRTCPCCMTFRRQQCVCSAEWN